MSSLSPLGPGFVLYFEFVKYLGWITFILTIVYFVPTAGLIY